MTPTYIPTSVGDLFAIVHPARNDGTRIGDPSANWVMLLPPLAEELNKSRKMIADQARLWAQQGVSVLIPDYGATGDSPGVLSDMNWLRWRQQMLDVLQWLHTQGCLYVTLWGVRVGALMAADLSRELTQNMKADLYPSLTSLLLWQPVVSGKLWLTQLLRLRVASQLMDQSLSISSDDNSSPVRESVAGLRQRLAAGERVEVAGYPLSGHLADSLDSLELGSLLAASAIPHVDWLEVSSAPIPVLTPISSRIVTEYSANNFSIHAQCVGGDSFWSTQEICRAPALLSASDTLLDLVISKTVTTEGGGQSSDQGAFSKLSTKINPTSCKTQNRSLTPVVFSCQKGEMMGVIHRSIHSQKTQDRMTTGVVIIVGGPQYRVGCHRQFYQLADALAAQGIPVLRFDCRGMGDSSGHFAGFTHLGADIGAAVDALKSHNPDVKKIVLWGLCDGASAAGYYASSDQSIAGLVLLNPWVRSEAGEAKAYLKHYYLRRLFSRELWGKVFRGDFSWRASMQSFRDLLMRVLGIPSSSGGMDNQLLGSELQEMTAQAQSDQNNRQTDEQINALNKKPVSESQNLVEKLGRNLLGFKGKVLVILSGNDLTAAEYRDALGQKNLLAKASKKDSYQSRSLDAADHTFSRSVWKRQVEEWTLAWIKTL